VKCRPKKRITSDEGNLNLEDEIPPEIVEKDFILT
jgi:hypothetical protein